MNFKQFKKKSLKDGEFREYYDKEELKERALKQLVADIIFDYHNNNFNQSEIKKDVVDYLLNGKFFEKYKECLEELLKEKYMSSYIEEKLKEFRDEIYGENDALFDRKGNNVSQQVENFILQALQEQEERIKQEILQIVIEDVPHKYQERLLKEINI